MFRVFPQPVHFLWECDISWGNHNLLLSTRHDCLLYDLPFRPVHRHQCTQHLPKMCDCLRDLLNHKQQLHWRHLRLRAVLLQLNLHHDLPPRNLWRFKYEMFSLWVLSIRWAVHWTMSFWLSGSHWDYFYLLTLQRFHLQYLSQENICVDVQGDKWKFFLTSNRSIWRIKLELYSGNIERRVESSDYIWRKASAAIDDYFDCAGPFHQYKQHVHLYSDQPHPRILGFIFSLCLLPSWSPGDRLRSKLQPADFLRNSQFLNLLHKKLLLSLR